MRARPVRLPARAGRPRPPDLLRDEGQLEPGGAADLRRARLRLRHRLGRRTRARAGGRRRPGARSCSPASARRAPRWRARSRPACAASTSRATASSSAVGRSPTRAGRTARVSLRVNPDVDAGTHPYISTGLKGNKFGIAQTEALARYRRAAALPGLEVVGIDCHIGSQITEIAPYLDALDRVLDLVEAIEADGIAHPPPRRRRRPGHHLHRRDAARRRRAGRAAARAHRRARPRPSRDAVRAGPLAGRQRRRAAHRGALPASPARPRTSASSTRR